MSAAAAAVAGTADVKYLVLGGGVAAGYGAAEFVRQGLQPGELTIVSAEAVAPYERPALSKAFLAPESPARLPGFHTCVGSGGERHTPDWYQQKGIDLLLGCPALALDVGARTVTCAGARTLRYETLIVATGARALRLEELGTPGAAAGGVFYLREAADAHALYAAAQGARDGRAVVVGGGYIGLECSAALALLGLRVTVVFPEAHLMSRLFPPEIAAFYEESWRAAGIDFCKGTTVAGIGTDAKGQVRSVSLADGRELAAEMVVVGVGARPRVELLTGQLELEQGGAKVDSWFRTSAPSVYAVGDVAAFPLLLSGATRRVEHVDHARRSAQHAVQAIVASERGRTIPAYDYLPFFYSRALGFAWQFYGENTGDVVLFGSRDVRARPAKFGAFWVKDGTLRGAFLEGGTAEEQSALARAARERPAVPDAQELASLGLDFVL